MTSHTGTTSCVRASLELHPDTLLGISKGRGCIIFLFQGKETNIHDCLVMPQPQCGLSFSTHHPYPTRRTVTGSTNEQGHEPSIRIVTSPESGLLVLPTHVCSYPWPHGCLVFPNSANFSVLESNALMYPK